MNFWSRKRQEAKKKSSILFASMDFFKKVIDDKISQFISEIKNRLIVPYLFLKHTVQSEIFRGCLSIKTDS